MRLFLLAVGMLAVAGLPARVAAGAASTNARVNVALNLRDGSRLVGTVEATNFALHADYAVLSLPVGKVRRLAVGDDRETVSVEMVNGDSLRGIADLPAWELQTAFGAVKIKVEHMDGQLLGRNADPFRMGSACPLIIGANDNGPQRHFNGQIDEIMVFRKALSAEDIADLYRAGL